MLESQHFPFLLGKWRSQHPTDPTIQRDVRGFVLAEHIAQCLNHTQDLYDSGFTGKLHDAMNLGAEISIEDFHHLCLLAVLVHDIGKTSQEFQHMLWMKEWAWDQKGWQQRFGPANLTTFEVKEFRQDTRHEFITRWVLTTKSPANQTKAWDWLVQQTSKCTSFPDAGKAAWIVVGAAFGHHRKTNDQDRKNYDIGRDSAVYLSKLSKDLGKLSVKHGFDRFPSLVDDLYTGEWLQVKEDQEDKEILLETPLSRAVKWVTILGDVLGSITPGDLSGTDAEYTRRKGDWRHKIQEFLFDLMQPIPPVDYLQRVVNAKKGLFLDKADLQSKMRGFQRDSATKKSTRLRASCGGGKSVAAFSWASEFPDKKLIYTLPTTGTTTQLYLDYKGDINRHSRSRLDALLAKSTMSQYPEAPTKGDETQEPLNTQNEVGVAISIGMSDVVNFATVDQLLGCMTFNHKSILWLLVLVDSILVFDEYHSYDDMLRTNLALFLDWFPKIPVLAMTATSTVSWDAFWKRHRPQLAIVESKDAAALIPRYRVHTITELEAPKYYTSNTLWVVNQVKVAQGIGMDFRDCLVYHSRFKYSHKRAIQEELVRAFRNKKGTRAVATQVAQMSLDISGSTGITELCPPEDFVQRLGRINRETPVHGVSDIYVYMPANTLPYWQKNPEDSNAQKTWEWVQSLEGRDLSQQDLTEEAAKIERTLGVTKRDFRILNTYPQPVRKTDEITFPVLVGKTPDQVMRMLSWEIQEQEISTTIPTKLRGMLPYVQHHFLVNWRYDTRLGLITP